jgi:hypothetical protein
MLLLLQRHRVARIDRQHQQMPIIVSIVTILISTWLTKTKFYGSSCNDCFHWPGWWSDDLWLFPLYPSTSMDDRSISSHANIGSMQQFRYRSGILVALFKESSWEGIDGSIGPVGTGRPAAVGSFFRWRWSSCACVGPAGRLEGSYQNRSDDGEGWDRKIPKTSVSVGPGANVQREKEGREREREKKEEEEENSWGPVGQINAPVSCNGHMHDHQFIIGFCY